MAQHSLPTALTDYPPELIQAVIFNATFDADRVGSFLTSMGSKLPLSLPVCFLSGLGAALQLFEWEQQGIRIHLDAGLPPAQQAILDVFRSETGKTDPETCQRVRKLPSEVMRLNVEYFAWTGRIELNADVTLGEADEDKVLEELADYLWTHRSINAVGGSPP